MYGAEHGAHVSWGHTTQRSGWRRSETETKRDRKWAGEPDDMGGQLQTVVWFWRTEASAILSFLIHAVRWGTTIPEGRQEPSAIRKERKEKSTGFRSLGTNLKEEKENYCADFSMKKKCLFDHWVIQNKETVQEIAQTRQWNPSVTEKSPSARTHSRHTNPHTPTHVDKEAAETRTPEK